MSVFVDPPPRTDPNARKSVDPVNLIAKIEADPERSMPVRDDYWFPEDFTERGYTEMELRIALEAVRDLTSWKMPVEANFPTLNDDERDLIGVALIFYCGSHTEFIHPRSGGITAVAAGYYNCIGA